MRAGKYVQQLRGHSKYRAFIPEFLPFPVKDGLVLQDLLSKANLALGRLDGIAEILPDVEGWLKFFLTGIAQTAGNAVSTARKILKLRAKDMEKVSTLNRSTQRAIKLLSALYRTPIVRVADVERIVQLKNPNALVLVSKFLRLGILKEQTGRKRDRLFSYQEYIDLFV